jgi:hypothetical protein
VVTRSPTQTLRELLTGHSTGEIADLAVHRPTLEDVYLAMLAGVE